MIINYIVLRHPGTWLLLQLLCWWHTVLSLFSTRWYNGSCTYLRLPGRHLGMDERTPPTAQPGKDWASCLPCHSNSTTWLHDSVRFINNYPINFCQTSWSNLWWPADLQRPHCKDCLILQVCTTQHQKDQALSDRACCTTSCPGPCNFKTGLLQCSSGWTSIKHNQTSTNDSECSGTTGLQRAQTPRGTITERLKITLQNILFHRSWLVEWSSHPHPECWIPVNLQATTENSSLLTLLDYLKKSLSLFPSEIGLATHFSFPSFILLPLLACTYLNNAWDLVLQALPLSVCLFKMNCFMFSPIVSRFG